MTVNCEAATDTGRRRSHNEDSYLVNSDEQLYVVADGLGGEAAGEVASCIATQAVEQFIRDSGGRQEDGLDPEGGEQLCPAGRRLHAAIAKAHQEVRKAARANPALNGMGTTLTSVLLSGTRAVLGHVGDSRAYLWRKNGGLSQLTRDHSLVARYVELGILTPQQASVHPLRNTLTNALGISRHLSIDIVELELRSDDCVLLCSDGLTKLVTDAHIGEALAGVNGSPRRAVDGLVRKANELGGDDNITVVLLRCDN